MSNKHKLTTTGGAPVADNQNVMTAGARGPMLLQDIWLPVFQEVRQLCK